jgi:hypothetical protein
LHVRQRRSRLFVDLEKIVERGGYDGWYSFTAETRFSSIEWPCGGDDEEVEEGAVPGPGGVLIAPGSEVPVGLRVAVVSVALAEGENTSWEIGGIATVGSEGFEIGPMVFYHSGYPPQRNEWEFVADICPGADGCPIVTVVRHRATVSDDEYFWGNWVRATFDASSIIRPHQPQVCIRRCNDRADRDDFEVLPMICFGRSDTAR